jgi:hypothetical protein
MTFEEIVPELVSDGESLEPTAGITIAVHDSEDVPYSHQTPRDTSV